MALNGKRNRDHQKTGAKNEKSGTRSRDISVNVPFFGKKGSEGVSVLLPLIANLKITKPEKMTPRGRTGRRPKAGEED